MKAITYIALSALFTGSVYAQSNSNTNNNKVVPVKPVQVKLDRSKRPQPGPAPLVKMGKAEKFVLPNGLTVFVVENHKIPKVNINLSLDLDPMAEGEKLGYVEATGMMLGTATKTMTKDQINEKVDFIGADLNTNAQGASGSCLKKHLDPFMKIFSDVVLNPVFKQEELDKIKTQGKSGLATQKNDPNAMMSNLSKAVIYGKDHAYGEVQTEQNIDNITLADCQGYYDNYFKANKGYITIVGDITPDEAKKILTQYFGNWAKGDVKEHKVPDVNPPLATKVSMVDKPGAAQSTIRITYPIDFKPGNPDAIKVTVMNEILGGGASARLFRNLRETYNFTYGAYSGFSTDEHIGSFTAFADVRSSASDSAVAEFLREINRMRTEKVGVDELEAAKKNLAGGFSISLEKPSTIAKFALSTEVNKLPADYYETYLAKLSDVTIDDVYAMAQKYLKPENAHILVVGDKAKVANGLKKFSADGNVAVYDYKGDKAVGSKPAPAGVTAQTVYDNYFKALGGVEALKGVKDQTIVMEGEIQGMKMSMTSKKKVVTTVTGKKKNQKTTNTYKSYEEVSIAGMGAVQKKTCDGTKATEFSMMGGGNKNLEGKELEEAKTDGRLFVEMEYTTLGYKTELKGIETLDGGEAYKIEVTDPSGEKHNEYYDVKTGLKVKTDALISTPQGQFNVSTEYSDYKAVGNVMFPHSVTIDQGGQVIAGKAKTITVNSNIPDDVFIIKE